MLLNRNRQLWRLQALLPEAISLPLLRRLEIAKLVRHCGYGDMVVGHFLSILDRLPRQLLRDSEVHELEMDGAESKGGVVQGAGCRGVVGETVVGDGVGVGVLGPLEVGALTLDGVEVHMMVRKGKVLEAQGV